MSVFQVNINGQTQVVDVHDDTPLLWVLRDSLGLVGTKYGCGIAQCGACTVHLDGRPVKSCMIPISSLTDEKIITIEGISAKGDHPVQKAWDEEDVPQCGYCQSGQVMSAISLLREKPTPTDEDIDNYMIGNICRCGTYKRIRKAIHSASKKGGKI